MSANNNHPQKNIGASSPFGNSLPMNPSLQQQLGSGFPGQFQLSEAQVQALVQAQSKAEAQAQAHAKMIAAHARMQALQAAQGLSFNQGPSGGVGNLGSQSPAFSGAGSASAKRLPQRPPVRPPSFSPSNTASPMRLMNASAANRKKQKLPEKQLQERVAAILPESALYTQLLEFESRVDAALTRKKIDIQEALKMPSYLQKTLRIYVFNTFANQIRTVPKKPNAEPPTWTLKIVGRILEEGVDPDQAAMMQKSSSSYPRFSSFFKRVTITLDQKVYPDNHLIIWDRARSPAPHEGFEVKRKGDQEFTASIRLEMNYMPEKYKLSPALTELLGIEVDTRARIIAAVWHYVKARKLQCPDDPSSFNCDPPLLKVFGEGKIKFTSVTQKITPHLFPPQPIHLEHRIKLSGNSPVGTACYDVLVDVPFPIQRELNALLASTEKTKELEACDEAICTAIRKIHEHRRRRAFFLGFSQSPIEFINALIDSQNKDLKVVTDEASRNAEKERHSEFFNQPWVEDAVIRYLNRKLPHEGFEVKRKGDQEFTASIRLEMNYMPEKYKLSPALTELLGIEVDTRARIIAAVWHYVKARKLQCPDDPSSFNCDPPLLKVFGEGKIKFTSVTQKITPHLFPPQPIHLEHRIKLSGNSPVGTACYDVLVDVPFPIQRELNALLASTEKTKELEACDEAICTAIRKIHEHRRRRAFFLGFSQSPIEFINALIDSQNKDLKVVTDEASRNAEKERHSEFFNQPWVEDAVIRYLNRKLPADTPGNK
ncbi:SWI/SNF transcription activation complex subunit [Handroanthus impetiginosus]|uniref:SWI/SNF transcription activation complex subunit n=1 Tax=Handroanthus impetiginosus TaxID=429701 RepID=A0A2G9GWY6_9LAMI|nr:SWI/SNF transcription activation complex subunit [Handroanthus impetiginosus]